MMFRPLIVVWSVNVAPLAIVRMPEPASLTPVFGLVAFRLIWTCVPVAVLLPPSCSVRPPSSPKFVLVNDAPPDAIVVPDPLSVPPENADGPPVAVSVPLPLSSPDDCASEPVITVPLKVAVPPVNVSNPEPVPPLTVVCPPLKVAFP